MKIFAFALREYDELKYMEQYSKELGFEFDYTSDYPSMDNLELARGYDGVSIITNPMDEERLNKLKEIGVKYISTRSIGYEHIDVKHCKKIGMKAAHVTYSANSVANYTIMMMLMACRKITYILDKADLNDFDLEGKMGKELSLCTVGVIGTGKIGETLIRHLQGFGCKIICYDLYKKDSLDGLCTYVDLETLYKESDIITLHVPATDSNYHMIDDKAIEMMKDDVIIVNAARGTLIDTDALVKGLESGKIGAAALDTFEGEKGLYYLNFEKKVLYNKNMAILKSFPNVIFSPHMAFYTDQAVSDMVGNSVKGIMLFEKEGDNPFEVSYE